MMLFGAQVVEVERVGDEAVERDVHVEKKKNFDVQKYLLYLFCRKLKKCICLS